MSEAILSVFEAFLPVSEDFLSVSQAFLSAFEAVFSVSEVFFSMYETFLPLVEAFLLVFAAFLSECEASLSVFEALLLADLCTLPKASGLCEETLPRWYYDYSEARCMPFYYTGCDGNANRYITRGECEATCPGDQAEREEDVCYMPSSQGDCDNYVPRWFFDAQEGQCKSFLYGGCGGNNNNFDTYDDCENYCGNRKKIPTEEEFQTEFCFLEQSQGTCSDYQAYWYYDSQDGVCKQFLFSGCGGNENRFKTRQECENKCGEAQDICQLPLVVGPCSGSFRQFYFDSSSNQCYEFDYGGCQGNKNRFDSMRLCQQRCQTTTTPHYPGPEERPTSELPEICKLPVEVGPCQALLPNWYYDAQAGRCIAFSYGGCSGNANRFQSVELCERQCGKYRDQDVCNLPVNPGPCNEALRKWHYDPYVRMCKSFAYSGCEGNGNRFSTERECEAECIYHDNILPSNNSQEAHTMICELSAGEGPCTEGYKRWHFNKEHGTCVMFLYSGCGGNQNRFKTFNACTEFCASAIEKYRRTETSTTAAVGPSGYTQPAGVDRCQDSEINCQLLQCPYGVQKRVDSDGCDRCSCYDPCNEIQCLDGMECTVELVPARGGSSENTFRGVCRQTNKPGRCPQNNGQSYQCHDECRNDAGCDAALKCCYNGCGYSCVSPVREEDEPGYTAPPVTVPEYGEAPRITEFDEDVTVEENDVLAITCVAQGSPTPNITWYRGTYKVNTESVSSRFRILPDGSLQVVNVERGDTGKYTCEAKNGVGSPASRTAQLTVTDPTPREAAVVPWNPVNTVTSLGGNMVLYCRAVGWPRPVITWWRGRDMLPLTSEQFEQFRDGSLTIRLVTLRSLGPYTCQVYNGQGKATSQTVVLRALGPVNNFLDRDRDFLQYIVDPPKAPPTAAPQTPDSTTRFPAYRPGQRPYWPPYYSPSLSGTTEAPTTRAFIVPLRAVIRLNSTEFPPHSTIRIPCEVRGIPVPTTTWFKGDNQITASRKYSIEEDSTLVISDAEVGDSGQYKCHVQNEYGIADSSTVIAIKGVYVHPTCTDNPFFANCKLIVRAKYCTNKYYARFCCRSCTLDGQLPSQGPHLTHSKKRK